VTKQNPLKYDTFNDHYIKGATVDSETFTACSVLQSIVMIVNVLYIDQYIVAKVPIKTSGIFCMDS